MYTHNIYVVSNIATIICNCTLIIQVSGHVFSICIIDSHRIPVANIASSQVLHKKYA